MFIKFMLTAVIRVGWRERQAKTDRDRPAIPKGKQMMRRIHREIAEISKMMRADDGSGQSDGNRGGA